MLVNILTNPTVFALLSSAPKSTNLLTSSELREIRTCTQPSYCPEPNLDMYAVQATIQLSLAKNVAERIYSCFLLNSNVCSLQCQRQNSDQSCRSFHPIALVAESSCQSRFAVMPPLLSTLLDKGHENQVFRKLTQLLISQTFCLVLANISAILISRW